MRLLQHMSKQPELGGLLLQQQQLDAVSFMKVEALLELTVFRLNRLKADWLRQGCMWASLDACVVWLCLDLADTEHVDTASHR